VGEDRRRAVTLHSCWREKRMTRGGQPRKSEQGQTLKTGGEEKNGEKGRSPSYQGIVKKSQWNWEWSKGKMSK